MFRLLKYLKVQTRKLGLSRQINIEFLFPFTALVILCYALSVRIFAMPPIGKILDPFIGIVQNENDIHSENEHRNIPNMGLRRGVHIDFDERNVPHLFASSTEDLYFAQGYVTAGLRLWQMDFLSYTAAGRLSEIMGDRMLEYDRNQRRLGILEAAKNSLILMEKDPDTFKMLNAYTKGVNAFIHESRYKNFSVEYKFLDYEPESWSNLKTVLIVKYMASILSGYEEDGMMTNLMLALGEEDFNKYFPDFNSYITPVVADSSKGFSTSNYFLKKPTYLNFSFMVSGNKESSNDYNPRLGSNSWVVSGKKTKSGFPILCNDPHLGLSLPAIWIEMQLSSPKGNTYGVTIPGVPSIIIGFNEYIAWGLTNGADDAKDWYKVKISVDNSTYQWDSSWLPMRQVVEQIKIRDHKTLYDTVNYTIHGPIVYNKDFHGSQAGLKNCALKWGLHSPSNELLTFLQLNQAKNYGEYKFAISHYCSPIQNFTFAGPDNSISVDHQGNMPVKWQGEGKFILDGTKSACLSTQYIPEDSLPHLRNPSCNFIIAANQHPTGPHYPYYYNGKYMENRAKRIKQILEHENNFDIQKMMEMQLDNRSFFAQQALPVLFNYLVKAPISFEMKEQLRKLKNWNGGYSVNDENAELFNLWWQNIKKYTWDEFNEYTFDARQPEDYILLELLHCEPSNKHFDQLETTKKETAADIVQLAFDSASNEYNRLKIAGPVNWGYLHHVNFQHILNIIPFSRNGLPSSGYAEVINSISENWGPSWRMIVELGPRPKAFGIYPGGQSGNVGSQHYDDFVTDWNKGKYYPLNFFLSVAEADSQTNRQWNLF